MITVQLPLLHTGQVNAFKARTRFFALRCGRRWGKTTQLETIACDGAIKQQNIGIFTPTYKQQDEIYSSIQDTLEPVIGTSNRNSGIIRTKTGGRIDFWSLEDNRAGRGRKYHKALIDEAAFTKNKSMLNTWRAAIRPTLLDFRGSCWAMSTPNGDDPENFFWQLCNNPEHGFTEYHAPTSTNPHLPPDELALLQEQNHPLVFRQEYLAEFVDWAGAQFFDLKKCLVEGQPVEYPTLCDYVFATIDTAAKSGQKHDSTAVCYWARSTHGGYPLILLDWEILQIDGSLLEVWLPTVFQNLEKFATDCRARQGSLGAFIEDKSSGIVLLQHAQNQGWPATGIDSKLTSMGKDERAISVSGYIYQGLVKISQWAHQKVIMHKGTSRNHLEAQVFGYVMGQQNKADDALDTWCYGVALALGNNDGF
jgi:hypothetical protein